MSDDDEVTTLKAMTENMAIKLALLQLGIDRLEELTAVAITQHERGLQDALKLTLLAIRDQARKALAI